jgi:hypothetical protein
MSDRHAHRREYLRKSCVTIRDMLKAKPEANP